MTADHGEFVYEGSRRRLVPHSHEGTALTFGCEACNVKVARDQRNALWADAPLRTCTWTFDMPAPYVKVSFAMDVRVPSGVTGWEVDDWHAGDTGEPLTNAIAALVQPESDEDHEIVADLMMSVAGRIRSCVIGPIVPQQTAPPAQEGLFGG